MADREPKFISLAELIRFLIVTLAKWSQIKQYGEIRIVVQAGQIEFVHEDASYRGQLPKRGGPGEAAADIAARQLAAAS